MAPAPAGETDFSDLLEKSPDQLADIGDSDWDDIDDFVSRGSTIAQLKMWLTDNEVQLPASTAKKAEFVTLAVKKLTEKRENAIEERERSAAKSPPKTALTTKRRGSVTSRKRKSSDEVEPTSEGKPSPAKISEDTTPKKRTKSLGRKSLSGTPMINPKFLSSLTEVETVIVESPAVMSPAAESRSMDSIPPGSPVNDGQSDRSYQSPILTTSDRNPFQSGSGKKSKKESARAEASSVVRSRRDLVKSPFRVVSSSVTRQPVRQTSQGSVKNQLHSIKGSSPLTTTPKASVEPRNLFSIGGASAPRRVVRQTVVVPTAPSRPSLWRYLLISVVVVAIGVFVSILFPRLRETVVYCPSNPSDPALPGCIPCPARALCDRSGKAHCFEGLVLQNHRCVDDPEVVLLSEDMSDDISSLCSRHLGRVLCGDQGEPYLSLQDVERHLFQLYGRQNRYKDALRKTMDLVRLNTTSSLHYASNPARVWATQPSRPFLCAIRHWFLEHAPVFAAVLLAIISVSVFILRQRRRALRKRRAVLIFKEALNVLKASQGPVALDHLSATAFEHCGLEPDAQVWNIALDQLSRDSRINNAITFRNGVQKKGMLFSQIPLRTSDNKPVHLYPTVEQH